MLFDLTGPQLAVFAVLVVAFVLLITERIRSDIVALLIVLSVWAIGVLEPEEALSGFSSEPAIVVAGIFVLTGALERTGVSAAAGRLIARLAGSSYSRAILVIMPAVAVLSAFTHHVTTTAALLPVTLKLAKDKDIAASRLLMPLAFAASLGTTITIIGAPAFLIASGILRAAGRPGLGIFSIAPIGLALSVAGTLFVLLAGRLLLPVRRGEEDSAGRFRLDAYFTELTVLADSPFLGKNMAELEADSRYSFRVVGWLRDGRRVPRPFTDRPLAEGDVLIVRTSPEELVQIRQEAGVELHPVAQYGEQVAAPAGDSADLPDQLVQAVVAPHSDLVGRSLGQIDFRERYGALVIAMWRQQGWIQQELARVRLRAGDVLVIQGDEEALARVSNDRAFLMLAPFHGEAQRRRKAWVAGVIMAASVAGAAFVNIEMAAVAGAVAMIQTGCLTARQAYRAIDARIYVFIAGAIPLGLAMEKSGASQKLADLLQRAAGGWNETVILLTIFAVVAVLTQFMSDSATTAIFAPVALALAQALDRPPEPYVVTVAMAAVASFLTPIGHHGNLLIYGPGGYRFADFVRAGAPLTAIVGVIVVVMAQWLWG